MKNNSHFWHSLVRPHLEYAAAAWDPYLVGDCKQLEKVQRRAARFVKRDYRSTTSHFLTWLANPLQPWEKQLLITRVQESSRCGWYFHLAFSSFFQAHSFSWWRHILSCPLEPILTNTPSIIVQLLTGMPSQNLWSLVLPFICSSVRYIPAWPTPSNHSPIPAVTGGNPWPAVTEEPKSQWQTWLTVVLSCLSVTLVYCGQTVGWIKMPLGNEVGLSPGHIVLDGT